MRGSPALTYGLVLVGSLLPSASVSVALVQIQREWGLSNTESAVLYSVYQAGYIVAVVLILPLTDRVDARAVVVAGALVTLVASLLFSLAAQSLFPALLWRGLAGAGVGAVYMPGLRVVARQYMGATLGRAVGLYVAGYYVGNGASLGLTGLFLGFLSWRGAFVAVVLSGIATVALVLGSAVRGTRGETSMVTRPSWRALLDWPTVLVSLGYAAHSWQLFTVWGWLAPFLADSFERRGGVGVGSALSLAGALSAVVLGLGAIGVYLGGRCSDRLGRTLTAASVLAGGAFLSFGFGWLRDTPLVALLVVGLGYGFAISASSAVYSASLSEIAPPGLLGASLAFQATCGYLAGVAGPVVFGAVLDWFGKPAGWGPAFGSAGVIALLGAISMVWLRQLPAASRLAGGRR